MTRVIILSSYCEICHIEIMFDVREFGVINFRNSYIFCAEMFYELLNLKLLSGITTNAWFDS